MSYKGSVTRIEKVSRFVLVIVTLVLAGFLIALGNKVLGDVDTWVPAPLQESFVDQAAMTKARAAQASVDKEMGAFTETRALYQKSLDKAQRQYEAQKQSYDDWLQARTTIGSSQEDTEVRGRAKSLDHFRQIQESWQAKIDEVEAQSAGTALKVSEAQARVSQLEAEGQARYTIAMHRYTLKVFCLRLALVLPILALAVVLFLRSRKGRFWPMVWGYGIFSLYAFFMGLVPYMPSFGGYIRLVVGVLLTLLAAFYVIRQLNRYLQKKKEELEASTQDRSASIQEEIALRAFQSHSCPSCERDFLIRKWYPKVRQASEIRSIDEAPGFCNFCGLPLFGSCQACGHKNFLHFPYCSCCGSSLTKKES